MSNSIKITLSPFPQPINIKISKAERVAKIELSITNPTPFSAPDRNYVHTQIEESDIWIIQHNLNKFPTVILVDEDGYTIGGSLKFINSDTVHATFSQPVRGQAFVN